MAIQHHFDDDEQTASDEIQKRSGRLNRIAVDELKRYREEIALSHPGQVFEDSVELLRQAREERTSELEQEAAP